MTLDSYLSVGDRTYIKSEIKMAEGTELPKLGCNFIDLPPLSGGKAHVTSAETCPLELDHAAGCAVYLLILDASAKQNDSVANGDLMVLELHGLEETELSGKTLTEGTWRFELPCLDAQVIDLLDAPMAGIQAKDSNGNACTIMLTSAILRAMELEVTYEVLDAALFGSVRCDNIHAFMQDGSIVVIRQARAGEHVDAKTNVRWIEFGADAPIVLDEVARIEFPGGTRITVNAEE